MLFDGIGPAVKIFMGTGPAAAALNYTDSAWLEATITRAMEPYGVAGEFYFLQNQFLVFIAKK